MAKALTNIKAGPFEIRIDGALVGYTEGAIEANPELSGRDRIVAEYGTTPVGFVITGENFQITANLKEWIVANLAVLFPGLDATGNGGYFGGANATPGTDIAGTSQDNAKELRLHKIGNDASDWSEDWFQYCALPTTRPAITLDPGDTDRLIPTVFRGLADVTRSGKVGGYGINPNFANAES